MLQENAPNSSLNYLLLNQIKDIVISAHIEKSKQAKKNLWFSEPFNCEGCCKTEDIYLKKHLDFNTMGVLIVLAKIQEVYKVEIPCIDKDISLKEIHNFIVCQRN